MNKLHITPNVPLVVAIADPDGEYDFAVGAGQYQTTEGRILILPRPAVIQLNELNLKPGEQVRILHEAHRGKTSTWEVARAEAETGPEATAEASAGVTKPRKSQDAPKRRGRPASKYTIGAGRKVAKLEQKRKPTERRQPFLFDGKGTGTTGPAPAKLEQPWAYFEPRVYRTAAEGPAIVRRVPYGEMLRHIIRTVTGALKAEQVHMGDKPLQDLISVIYQDASRRQGVAYDFREDK